VQTGWTPTLIIIKKVTEIWRMHAMKKLHEFFMYLSRRSKTRKITKGIHRPSSEEIVPLNSIISQLNL
jgi:hypothetical protein